MHAYMHIQCCTAILHLYARVDWIKETTNSFMSIHPAKMGWMLVNEMGATNKQLIKQLQSICVHECNVVSVSKYCKYEHYNYLRGHP